MEQACIAGKTKIVQYLQQELQMPLGADCVTWTCRRFNLDLLRYLRDKKCEVEEKAVVGLLVAGPFRSPLLNVLLEMGAGKLFTDKHALEMGRYERVEVLSWMARNKLDINWKKLLEESRIIHAKLGYKPGVGANPVLLMPRFNGSAFKWLEKLVGSKSEPS